MTWAQHGWAARPWAADTVPAVPAGIVAYYFSDRGFTSAFGDTPEKTHFDPRLKQPLDLERSIAGEFPFGGLAASAGAIVLQNLDGALDGLVESGGIDGRDIFVNLGGKDGEEFWPYADFGAVFKGTASGWETTEDLLTIVLRDGLYKLRVPLQANFYAGTGAAEGGADLKGKPKPLGYGAPRNVPAPRVNAALLIYQAHDGLIAGIDAVYDRGVALAFDADYGSYAALAAATIPLGKYATSLAAGMFRLGGAPEGEATCDFRGAASPAYAETTADIVKAMAKRAGLTDAEIDGQSFADLNAAQAAPVELWTGTEPRLAADAAAELLRGIGGFAASTRAGKLRVGVFQGPRGAAKFELVKADIAGEISRRTVPPVKRVTVGWGWNYTVQTDIAGSVPDAHRDFIAAPSRFEPATSEATGSRHLLASDLEVPAHFQNQADALAEAGRLAALYGPERVLLEFPVKWRGLKTDLGDSGRVTHHRFGLDSGKWGVALALHDDAAAGRVRMVVFI